MPTLLFLFQDEVASCLPRLRRRWYIRLLRDCLRQVKTQFHLTFPGCFVPTTGCVELEGVHGVTQELNLNCGADF